MDGTEIQPMQMKSTTENNRDAEFCEDHMKSKITLVNVRVSWHPVFGVYWASCLLRGLRCNQL